MNDSTRPFLTRTQKPDKRQQKSGKYSYIARYRCPLTNQRKRARPLWNGRSSTFDHPEDAQRAINEAIQNTIVYGHPLGEIATRVEGWDDTDSELPIAKHGIPTVAEYLEDWLTRFPRSENTDRVNGYRIKAAMRIRIEDKPFGEWQMDKVRRTHAHAILDALLREGRAASGVKGVLSSVRAMWQDALSEDELVITNPFANLRLKSTDPRIAKQERGHKILTHDGMRLLANGADEPDGKAMIMLMSDCGLRLGEVIGLRGKDLDLEGAYVNVKGTAFGRKFVPGDKQTKKHVRSVPIPAELHQCLLDLAPFEPEERVFQSPRIDRYTHTSFYKLVWDRACRAAGIENVRPHDLRHSWETAVAAAGIDHADIAQAAGHSLQTMRSVYVHPLNRSDDALREVTNGK